MLELVQELQSMLLFVKYGFSLTHSPRMLHECSIGLSHHCFEKWLGARSASSQLDIKEPC